MRILLLVCATLLIAAPATADSHDSPDEALHLEDYAGKVVYVDFWASWCAPCKQSFPWMMDLQKRLADDGLVVITVNVDSDRQAADRFLARIGSELEVVYDPEGKLAEQYDLQTMPSSFLYGRDGELKLAHRGFIVSDTKSLESKIQAALEQKPVDAQSE